MAEATIKNIEVRYGNYVMDGVSGEWMQVDEIGDTVGATLLNREAYPLKGGWFMTGIPLSPEVLEACGFVNDWIGKKENRDNGFYRIDKELPLQIGYIVQDEFYEYEFNRKIIQLKYLHQLQNLYYSLTGSELQVNLAQNIAT